MTLEGLKPLSSHCPELRSLVVSIDATFRRRSPALKSFRDLFTRNSYPSANLAADPAKTIGVGGGSVCTQLKAMDIGLSMVNDPRHAASIISQFFPNVRRVGATHLRPCSETEQRPLREPEKIMKMLNKELCSRSAEQWAILDKMA